MKKLKVQRKLQAVNSLDCGPVSVQMVLDYFRIQRTVKELKKDLYYSDLGTYLYDNGLLFLKEGLKVTLVTANPLLFSGIERKQLKTKRAVREHLENIVKNKTKAFQEYKHGIALFIKFLDAGGDVSIEIPEFKHIREAIDANTLVMPNFHMNASGIIKDRDLGFHTFVITGYDEDYIYFKDPYPKTNKTKILIKDFMFAVHAASCVDIDNGSFLLIRKS